MLELLLTGRSVRRGGGEELKLKQSLTEGWTLEPDTRIPSLQRRQQLRAPTLIPQRDESVPHTPASFTKTRL